MKRYFVVLVLIFLSIRAFAQERDWQKAVQWTIYSIHGRNIWRLPVDSLSLFNHRDLNSDSMKLFLAQATILQSDKAPVWMGGYVTTCVLGNKKRKLLISSYGGFFYDEQEKRFYQLGPERQKEWLDYITDVAAAISSN
jgi:hypothetical protein